MGTVPASPDALDAAYAFCLERWREHAARMQSHRRPGSPPQDLRDACRYAACFAVLAFGGQVRGNWYHVWCETDEGQRVDLTGGVQFAQGVPEDLRQRARAAGLDVGDVGEHDERVWREREFQQAMSSVEDEAREWAERFLAERAAD
jgi:hypothetical protein